MMRLNLHMLIEETELVPSDVLPTYHLGSFSTMVSYACKQIPVTVRTGERSVLMRELIMLTELVHPKLLLMMGYTTRLELVFEPVVLGSLHLCLHTHSIPFRLEDVALQVTDALMYMEDRGVVHRAVSSHAVQVTTLAGLVKLGMLETAARAGQHVMRPRDTELYNWLGPELLASQHCQARVESDVYGLCCLIWELAHNQVPWAGRSASEIITDVGERKFSLPLQRDRIPLLVYRTLRQGLVWEVERRDLELGEIRDMMLLSRVQQDRTLICIQKKAARQQDDQDQENSKIPQTDQQIKPNVPRNRSLFAELSTVSKSAIQTDIKKYLLIDSDISEDEVEFISLNSSMTNKVGCCSSYPLINISKVNQDCVQNRDTDYSSSTDMSENFSVDAESFRGKGPRFDPRVEKQGRKITLSAPNLRKKSFNDIRKPVPTGTYLKLWRGSREPSPRRNESKKKGKLQSLRTGQVLEKEEQTRPGRGRVRDSVRFFESLISPPASPGWEEFHSAFEAMQVVGDADSGLGEGVLNTTAAATLSSFLQPSVIQQNRPGHGRSFSPASKPRSCALVESTSTNFSLLQRSNNSYSNDLSSVGCSPALIPSAPIKSESLLRKSLSVSSSPDSPAAAVDGSQVDFAVSDTRQTTFTTALSEATVEESADVSTNSALFLTANGSDVTIDTVKRSPLVVTFNTGVEENTTSIVSLSSDSDMVVTNTLVTTEDISNADELHPYLALEMVTGSGDPGSVVNSCRDEEERYEIADPLPLCMSQSSRDENLDSPEQTDITEDSAWQEGDTCLFQHSEDQGWYEANISHISLAEPTLVFDGGMVQLKPLEALKKILINGLAGSVDILESRGVMKNCEEIELRTHVDDLELGISKEEVDWMEGDACIARLVFKLCRAMVQCLCRWEEEVGRGWKRRWEEDDFWYEAVVDKVKADQAVVTFTHYGNSAIFHVADLKKKETPIDDSR